METKSAQLWKSFIYNVPDEAAHAWVEIYLPGYGWYPIEVTPGFCGVEEEVPDSQPNPSETHEPEPSDDPESTLSPTPSVAPSDEPTLTPKPSAEPSNSPSPSVHPGEANNADLIQALIRTAKWTLTAAGAFLMLFLMQFIPKGIRKKRLHSANSNRAVLYAYRYLIRLTRWGGIVQPDALELARKAKFSSHTLAADEQHR